MDIKVLLRNMVPTLVLAGPGLLLSTAIVGGLVHLLTPLPLGSALIFGCLISATDPVAVMALFKDLGAPKRLAMMVEGESVFNDATAIVTFQIVLAVITAGILDLQTITAGIGDFLIVFLGGLAVGLLFGYLFVAAIPVVGAEPLVHITLTLTTAYAAFFIADHFLHTSGIMAVLGAGLVIGYYGPVYFKTRVQEYLNIFWEDAAFVANSLIFLMLGLSEKIFLANTYKNVEGLLIPTLTAILVVLFARGVVVYTLIPLVNAVRHRQIDDRYKAVLAWGGLRGAIAVALAMSLPPDFPYRWQIIDFTFGVTLFMLVFNGTTMAWLIDRLRLNKASPLLELVNTYAHVVAKRVALQRLHEQAAVGLGASHAFERVKADYERQVKEAELALIARRTQLATDASVHRKLLWLRAASIEHHVYLNRHERGLLSLSTLRSLEQDLGPRASGPVVLAYNLPDFEDELTLSGEVIAEIYLGRIRRWDDQRIQAINPGAELPDRAIHAAHPSDGSGTTYILTDYLSAVSEVWRKRVGKGTRVAWPTGDAWAGEGNDGVAHRILLLRGGIGYLELTYAKNAGLRYAALRNSSGRRVWPSVASVQAAESSTPEQEESGILKPSLVNAPGDSAYPIAGFTYLLVYEDLAYLEDAAKVQALVRFLEWALTKGQSIAPDLHYTPLPPELCAKTLGRIEQIGN